MSTYIRVPLYQNIDEYKIRVLVFCIKYYFQMPKYQCILSNTVFLSLKTALFFYLTWFFEGQRPKEKKSHFSFFLFFYLSLLLPFIFNHKHWMLNHILVFKMLRIFYAPFNDTNESTLALWSFFIIVHFAQKVDFRMSKDPFPNFYTNLLLLYRGFPLTRFFWVPKNSVQGGVPVFENWSKKCDLLVLIIISILICT